MPFEPVEKEPVMSDDSYDRPGTTLPYMGNRIESIRRGLERLKTDEARGGMPRRKIRAKVELLRTSTQLIRDQTLGFANNRGERVKLGDIYSAIDLKKEALKARSRRKARNYWIRKTLVAAEEWLEEWRMLTDVQPAEPDFTEDLWDGIINEVVAKRESAKPHDQMARKIDEFDDGLDDLDDSEDDDRKQEDN